jgi:hypothetical protein
MFFEPLMGLDLVEIGSFGGAFIEDFIDEGLEFLREVFRENTLTFEYLLIGDILILSLKRSHPTGQLIQQHSHGPNIYPLIIATTLNDFRRYIIHGATKSLSLTIHITKNLTKQEHRSTIQNRSS